MDITPFYGAIIASITLLFGRLVSKVSFDRHYREHSVWVKDIELLHQLEGSNQSRNSRALAIVIRSRLSTKLANVIVHPGRRMSYYALVLFAFIFAAIFAAMNEPLHDEVLVNGVFGLIFIILIVDVCVQANLNEKIRRQLNANSFELMSDLKINKFERMFLSRESLEIGTSLVQSFLLITGEKQPDGIAEETVSTSETTRRGFKATRTILRDFKFRPHRAKLASKTEVEPRTVE